MRSVQALAIYLAFVFVGGALIAPWLYEGVQMAARNVPALESVASKPFPRYVNRALLLLALAGLIPYLRAAGLWSRGTIGLGKSPHTWKHLALGFLCGLLSLAVVVVCALAGGGRRLNAYAGAGDVLTHCLTAALAAVLVAVLEEVVFRGALYGSLKRAMPWKTALLVSSAIYALVHFLQRPGSVPSVQWNSGLLVLGQMLAGFADAEKLLPGFLNLTIVGSILALAYQRFGTLHFSIGLHAGWIFWLKIYGFLTDSVPGSAAWFFGSSKLIDGWLAFLVLAAAAMIAPLGLRAGERADVVPKSPRMDFK